jgi:hypothetical protein
MARKVLYGTVTPTAGTFQTAEIRLPASYAQSFGPLSIAPDALMSRVSVSDPVDVTLFNQLTSGGLPYFYTANNSDPTSGYFGLWSTYFQYDLTGGNPIDVDFILVWRDTIDPTYSVLEDTVD